MEVKWETHNGKNILIVDYSGIILDEDMIAHLNKAVAELKEVKKGEKLLLCHARFFRGCKTSRQRLAHRIHNQIGHHGDNGRKGHFAERL
jgi:hypothetical protein